MNHIKKFFYKYSLIDWLLLGIIVGSNGWWFLWGYNISGYFWMICALFLFFLFRNKMNRSKNIGASLAFFLYFVVLQIIMFAELHISSIIISILFVIGYHITPKQGQNTLILLTHYVAITIIISLPAWLIHQFVYPLPLLGQIDIGAMKVGVPGAVIMENYGYFVMPVHSMAVYRFYGPFDEPGVLGTISAFILWANRYNFKKIENTIIFIGAVCTFSMAFYILSMIGLILQSGFSFKKVVVVPVFIVGISFAIVNIFQGNEGFQASVIERFTNYGDHGTDSRNTEIVNAFWDKYIFSLDSLFGMGSSYMASKFGGGGASYKNFIIEYGILGFVIIIISYLSMNPKKSKFEYCTLLMFLFSFLQRPLLLSGYEVVMYMITIKASQIIRQTYGESHP